MSSDVVTFNPISVLEQISSVSGNDKCADCSSSGKNKVDMLVVGGCCLSSYSVIASSVSYCRFHQVNHMTFIT